MQTASATTITTLQFKNDFCNRSPLHSVYSVVTLLYFSVVNFYYKAAKEE